MYFNGEKLTLENYSEVLSNYSLDIRDEVRSMILDGIDLTSWVEKCKNEPYKLNQIRLASKEGVSSTLLSVGDSNVIYQIRRLRNDGFPVSELERYVGKGFAPWQWSYILNWFSKGKLDENYNLGVLPDSMWFYMDIGLNKGLPMYLFCTGRKYSENFMKSCFTLLANGVNIEKLLQGFWNESIVITLAENSSRRWFGKVFPYVFDFTSQEYFRVLSDLAKKLVTLDDLDLLEETSNGVVYRFSSFQLDKAYEALHLGLDYKKLLEKPMSEAQTDLILEELRSSNVSRLKGRL